MMDTCAASEISRLSLLESDTSREISGASYKFRQTSLFLLPVRALFLPVRAISPAGACIG
jgi:hypothetical protein